MTQKFILNGICVATFLVNIVPTAYGEDYKNSSGPPNADTTATDYSALSNEDLNALKGNSKNLVQEVRQAIEKDKTLSTNAESITIIPEGQTIVLKGKVLTPLEKLAIEKAAIDIAGQANVRSELKVIH